MAELPPRIVSIPVNIHYGMEQRVQCKLPNGVVWDISWDRFLSRVVLHVHGQAFIIDCSNTGIIAEHITLCQVIHAIGYDMQNYVVENLWCENENISIDELLDTSIEEIPLLQCDICLSYE